MNNKPIYNQPSHPVIPTIMEERYQTLREYEWAISLTIFTDLLKSLKDLNHEESLALLRENLRLIELGSDLARAAVHADKLHDAEKLKAPELSEEFERCIEIVYSEKPKVTPPSNLGKNGPNFKPSNN